MSKGTTTREKIASTAAELINTRGYHGTSLSELMEATELKKGGIYNHYINKEAIAMAAFDFAFLKILERFKTIFNEAGNAEEKLRSVIDVFASYASNPVIDGSFPLIGMAIHSESLSLDYKNKVLNAQSKMQYFIQVLIAEGVEAGLFRADLNTLASVKYIASALYGGLYCSNIMKDPEYMQAINNELGLWISRNLK